MKTIKQLSKAVDWLTVNTMQCKTQKEDQIKKLTWNEMRSMEMRDELGRRRLMQSSGSHLRKMVGEEGDDGDWIGMIDWEKCDCEEELK